jgi:hypothetical protein
MEMLLAMIRLLGFESRSVALLFGTQNQNPIQKLRTAFHHVALVVFFASGATAQGVGAVEDIADVNGLGGGFREVATGVTWLDYSNFFGQSFLEVRQSLVGTGFRLATKSELERLFDAVGGANDRLGIEIPFGGQSSSQRGMYDDSSTGSDPQFVGLAQSSLANEFGHLVR